MRKRILIPTLLSIALLLTLCGWLFTPQKAAAQCSTPSTCKTCHEVQAQKPVNFSGDWHIQHSFVDFCAECHGGNQRALEKDAAHANMATTLTAMSPNCVSCHDTDLEAKFGVYASQLGVNPGILAQARQLAAQADNGKPKFLSIDSMALPLPGAKPQTPKVTIVLNQTLSKNDLANTALVGVLALIVTGGGTYVAWNERRRKATAETRPGYLTWIWKQLRNPSWSPYSAGVLLGFTATLAVVAAHHLLSASGGNATVVSTALNPLFPNFIEKNIYFRFRFPPGLFTWEVLLLVGVFFGAMLSALLAGTFKLRWNDDAKWKKIFGPQGWKRFVIGFVGAIIIQYGASIAGGCTSGLAISGGMLLAPSAFLFMAGMFASGILTAWLIYRKKY